MRGSVSVGGPQLSQLPLRELGPPEICLGLSSLIRTVTKVNNPATTTCATCHTPIHLARSSPAHHSSGSTLWGPSIRCDRHGDRVAP